jgi:hypothetical protein
VSSRIEWDPAVPIPELLESEPDCVEGDHSGDGGFSFGPPYFSQSYGPFDCWWGYDCRYVEALSRVSPGDDPSDGSILFRCKVAIDLDAEPGRHSLRVRDLQIRDATGLVLPAVAIDGGVDVRLRVENEGSGATGSGCSIAATPTSAGGYPALAAFAIILAGLRARIGSMKTSWSTARDTQRTRSETATPNGDSFTSRHQALSIRCPLGRLKDLPTCPATSGDT